LSTKTAATAGVSQSWIFAMGQAESLGGGGVFAFSVFRPLALAFIVSMLQGV